jgi:hypothetical protein
MIPARCHFVWLGKTFPFLNALSVISAAKAGGFARVVLHAEDDLDETPHWQSMCRLVGFEPRRIEIGRLAREAGESERRVRDLYANMVSPAARSDVLRVLILAGEGGVYLDLDTVTVASFNRLRGLPSFVGQEATCFPEWSTQSHSAMSAARAYGLTALRFGLRATPGGHRLFPHLQHWYSLAANNAVLGSEAGHPVVVEYLRGMLAMDPSLARRRYAVGPDLLARICREQASSGLVLLPPAYFYPLGPVMSDHWWSHRDQQLFSKLASRYLPYLQGQLA